MAAGYNFSCLTSWPYYSNPAFLQLNLIWSWKQKLHRKGENESNILKQSWAPVPYQNHTYMNEIEKYKVISNCKSKAILNKKEITS